MARIELIDLAHSYKANPRADADFALHPLNLSWDDGGAYALLGPSGCGKTTLLNIISGLVVPSHGSVRFDGKDITKLSPQQRNIAQVFQFPVIYDTMTVFDNLAFPLRNRGITDPQLTRRVNEIAEMLELSADLNRRASGLTADAKQKISLGRGLVRNDVAAVLFDEPLTVIDPHLKWQLRRKLKEVHQQLKLTLVYVTHDQVEALTFADQVVVMSQGRVMQTGSAEELFEKPQHTFVGHFIGSPGMNLLDCEIEAGALKVAGLPLPGASLPAAIPMDKLQGSVRGANGTGRLTLGIRPEYVALVAPGTPGALAARTVRLQDVGISTLLTAKAGDALVRARLPAGADVPSETWLTLVNDHTCFYMNGELIR